MAPPPNELYTVLSFIGFVFCVIPFGWHFEAWNTGTCLFMIWTGFGCLMQCISSVMWNKNIYNMAQVYCQISICIQVGLYAAIPACSLCINRRLYKVATMETTVITYSQRLWDVMFDLIIGVGIPIIHIIAQYAVSRNRYNIFEDYGPSPTVVNTTLTLVFFSAWLAALSTASLIYSIANINFFYKCDRRFRQLMSSTRLSRDRYIRLMAISAIEILGTIPLVAVWLVKATKLGVDPWMGWGYSNEKYRRVYQVPASIWKSNPDSVFAVEMFRWSLVLSAFLFFALFGFTDEARGHYRDVYLPVASCIGRWMSGLVELLRSSQRTLFPGSSTSSDADSKGGVTVVTTVEEENEHKSSLSPTNKRNYFLVASDVKSNFSAPRYSHSRSSSVSLASPSGESFYEPQMREQSASVATVTLPAVPPASFPPYVRKKSISSPSELSFLDLY